MTNNKGNTLLECILSISLYGIIITLVFSAFISGYKLYKRIGYQMETEENICIALNRISDNIHYSNQHDKKTYIDGDRLIVDQWIYYLKGNILYEKKGGGINQLAVNIGEFNISMNNGILSLNIEGINRSNNLKPIGTKLMIYVGG